MSESTIETINIDNTPEPSAEDMMLDKYDQLCRLGLDPEAWA